MFSFMVFFYLSICVVILSERQPISGGSEDIFTDLTQPPSVDENCPEGLSDQSPYFSGNKRNSGFKRKRTGGDKKLVKKGKWLAKKATGSKRSYSSFKASTPARGTTSRSSTSTSTNFKSSSASVNKGLNMLAPPQPRTVKRE